MTTDEGLLQAILDDPEDDALRLVYADWLEERGDPRGELIHVQSLLAEGAPGDPHWPPLVRRERELLTRHGPEWVGPLRALGATRWAFRRGLVEEVTLGSDAFLRHADALLRLAPVRRLTVRVRRGELGAVLRAPALPRVTVLDLSHGALGPEGLAALARAPWLGRVPELDLSSNGLGDEGAARLAGAPGLAWVKALRLEGNQIGPRGVRALAASPRLQELIEIDLRGNPLHAEGARALTAATWPRLGVLGLGRAELTDSGLAVLPELDRLSRLTALDLRDNHLGDGGPSCWPQSPARPWRCWTCGGMGSALRGCARLSPRPPSGR